MASFGIPSRRWAKQLVWLLLSVVALAFLGLLVVNVVDCRRYNWAAHFEKSVGPERVRELARACFDLAEHAQSPNELTQYPTIVAELKPRSVWLFQGHGQISLYTQGDYRSVFLDFENYNGNEVVTVCDYTNGEGEGRPIFVQDQVAYELLHPKNRIVTLGQSTMHEFYEWIVLPDEMRVIDRPGTGGATISGRRPISKNERKEIETAMMAIPPSVRGRFFTSGGVDGISLIINFGADGRHTTNDVELANTWREEAAALVDLVKRLSPAGRELNFRSIVEEQLRRFPSEQMSMTWAARDKLDAPPRAWWCLWPAFVRETPKS